MKSFTKGPVLSRTAGFLLLMLSPVISLQAQQLDQQPAQDGVSDTSVKQSPPPGIVSGATDEASAKSTPLAANQEPTPQTTTPPQPTVPQTTNDDYVFPTADHRLRRYGRSVVGPFALLRVTGSAAIEQWLDSPEEWEQGAKGYGKRFASDFGRNAIRQTVTYGLSEALKLDTGFERSKRKGFMPRLSDALVHTVTSRTRTGKRVISAPILVGNYVAPIIAAETWYPERYSYKDGFRAGSYSLLAGFGINIFREFIFNW